MTRLELLTTACVADEMEVPIKSGKGGKGGKVKSRKQAIAIGLSEARKSLVCRQADARRRKG